MTTTTTPTPSVRMPKSQQIAEARAELSAARAIVKALKDGGAGEAEIGVAESLLVDALREYRRLVPREVPQRVAAVAAGPELVVIPAAPEPVVVAAPKPEPVVGDYLEPAMQQLLAERGLREAALEATRSWISLLTQADGHCAGNQPVLARKFIGLALKELQAQERALREADASLPKAKPAKKAAAPAADVRCLGCGQTIATGAKRYVVSEAPEFAHSRTACLDAATFSLQVSR